MKQDTHRTPHLGGAVVTKDHGGLSEPCALPAGWTEIPAPKSRDQRRYVSSEGKAAVQYLEGVSSVLTIAGEPGVTYACICTLPEVT